MKTTEFYPEQCCDTCGYVWHNHVDCVSCGTQDAPTDTYHEIERGEEFKCSLCGAVYVFSWECEGFGCVLFSEGSQIFPKSSTV